MKKLLTIQKKATDLGFLACAVLPVSRLDEESLHLEDWLKEGKHGTMGYMERNIDKRLDPRLLVENAKSIVVVLQNYHTHETQSDPDAPVLSKYAYGTDYHFVIKEKLQQLLAFIGENITPCSGRAFVDSAPVLERGWGRKAGLGWIGKNSCLISPEHGSFFFIGELVVDVELPFDKPSEVRDHCGRCTKCMDACPTGAITAPHILDARRCISYQTIELKGDLDPVLKGQFRNRVFGCDICQDVCPWNLKPEAHREEAFLPSPILMDLTAKEWHEMDSSRFRGLFRNSAVQRTGFKGLKRNLQFLKDDERQTL